MPGVLPGMPGLVAFAAVKFGGYCIAGWALRKVQQAVSAGVATIAATRTGLGILVGLPCFYASAYAMAKLLPQTNLNGSIIWIEYSFMFLLRILVWLLVISLFARQIELSKAKLWGYSIIGAVWSCVLDVPGIVLAIVTPGRIPIC